MAIGFLSEARPRVARVPAEQVRATPIVRRDPDLDLYRRYLSDSPSPSRFATILRSVDNGDVAALWELQEEIEAKSGHMGSVAEQRRAYTSLDWSIEPNLKAGYDERTARIVAKIVAKDVEAIRFNNLESIPDGGFDALLHFLSLAHGPNIAAAELIWFGGTVVESRPIPGNRLTRDPFTQKLGFETPEVWEGIPFDAFGPGKFIVFTPRTRGGAPLRVTLTHQSVWPYIVSAICIRDWMAFTELFGIPWRVVSHGTGVVDAAKSALMTMLKNMASDFCAVIPKDAELKTIQASGNGEAFEKLTAWADDKMSIIWVGQTLTSDIGDAGSRAAAQVHYRVRNDIKLADIKAEKMMVESQILRPITVRRFPSLPNPPVPLFSRKVAELKDLEEMRLKAENIGKAKDMGIPVGKDWAYEALGIPRPKDGDELLDESVEPGAAI